MAFDEVTGRYDGPALEQSILALWREHDVFHASLRATEGGPLFVWNDGPPTANGVGPASVAPKAPLPSPRSIGTETALLVHGTIPDRPRIDTAPVSSISIAKLFGALSAGGTGAWHPQMGSQSAQ